MDEKRSHVIKGQPQLRSGNGLDRSARFVRLVEGVRSALHAKPDRRMGQSSQVAGSPNSGIGNGLGQRAGLPPGTGRYDQAKVVLDHGGRHLVANDQALLDLAIEITGCLHDADRLKRPHTDELTLTDLDAGVTALYDSLAHLQGEGGAHIEDSADSRHPLAEEIGATASNWGPWVRRLPRAIEIAVVLLPIVHAAGRRYRTGLSTKITLRRAKRMLAAAERRLSKNARNGSPTDRLRIAWQHRRFTHEASGRWRAQQS